MLTTTKPPKCKHCRQYFTAEEFGLRLHPNCVNGWWEAFNAKQQAKKAKAEKAKDRATREKLKTIPQLIKEAQVEFNAYIRLRDQLAGHACISSGRPLDWSGNNVDAGHYRSTGAASHLRFDERNCHAQSKHDNQFLAGNAVDYRIGLVARIGLDAVEALESDNEPVKWDRDTLRQIKTIYRAKTRDLRKEKA